MRIILLGPPGCGKGTQGAILAKNKNIPKISTGDILREVSKEPTPLGRELAEIMSSGQYVPDNIVLDLLKQRIMKEDCKFGFILDGFPRTIPQAEYLEENVAIDCVLEIVTPEEAIIQRLSGRRVHEASGRVYHIVYNPPVTEGKDDITGEPLVQRKDDKEEVVRERLQVYKNQTKPLVDWYKSKNYLSYITVEATGSIDDISQNIEKQFLELKKVKS